MNPIISLPVHHPEGYDFRTLWQDGVDTASAFWNHTPRDLQSHPLDSHSFLIRVTGRLERSSFVLRRWWYIFYWRQMWCNNIIHNIEKNSSDAASAFWNLRSLKSNHIASAVLGGCEGTISLPMVWTDHGTPLSSYPNEGVRFLG